MPYLLDADVLIRAKREHYRFAVFPCFWEWILRKAAAGVVHSVQAVENELTAGRDDLATWVLATNGLFLPPDGATAAAAQQVTAWVQAPARTYGTHAVAGFFAAADYWLIAHAVAARWTVVTHEVPAPRALHRVKIPDVCNGLGVDWTTPFDMLQREGTTFTG